MKARLDNLSAQNARLVREIARLTLEIEREQQRFLLPAGGAGEKTSEFQLKSA